MLEFHQFLHKARKLLFSQLVTAKFHLAQPKSQKTKNWGKNASGKFHSAENPEEPSMPAKFLVSCKN